MLDLKPRNLRHENIKKYQIFNIYGNLIVFQDTNRLTPTENTTVESEKQFFDVQQIKFYFPTSNINQFSISQKERNMNYR